ncbi:MAG TPA: flavin reductase family protein [Bryobacteraceae bacterium]
MIIDPAGKDPFDVYRLLSGSVLPRPIAFVSTLSAQGVPHLAPFSFFTVISANPPVICFCPMIRGGERPKKDTLVNIEATGEFVVNIVSEDFAEKMNVCSGEYAPDTDEFEVSGLTPAPSELVKPPRVKESRVSMECKLHQVVHVSPKFLGGSLVMGEVLRFHVQDSMINKICEIDADQLNAIGRMAGPTYVRTRDRFEMVRPA